MLKHFIMWGPSEKKKKHIITYSLASSPQNHNIKMAGRSFRQIGVKGLIIKIFIEGQEYHIYVHTHLYQQQSQT